MLLAIYGGLTFWFKGFLIEGMKGGKGKGKDAEIGYLPELPIPVVVINADQFFLVDYGRPAFFEEVLDELEYFIRNMTKKGFSMDEIEEVIEFVEVLHSFHHGDNA